MFRSFSSNVNRKPAPAPVVEFSGKWKNELRSEMELTVDNGVVSGKYRTAVGEPDKQEEFDLLGFASGDLIVFCVNFGAYDSMTSWAGQHTIENGTEKIYTLWHLARNIADADEPQQLWSAIWTGANTFTR